jgi:hypothetical protein
MTMAKKKYKYVIGIDAGTNTGWAVVENGVLTTLKNYKIFVAMEELLQYPPDETWVVVEDARKRTIFSKSAMAVYGKLQRGGAIKMAEYKVLTQSSQGAGSVKRDCAIWEDYLTTKGYAFEMFTAGSKKTKISKDFFHKVAKWEGNSSEHARDAAWMINWAWLK